MPQLDAAQLDDFFSALPPEALLGSRYGIERETLRVDLSGSLATTPHPKALGSALTHPSITTDYSEALLEFVTKTAATPDVVIGLLSDLHQFTSNVLGDERLWPLSMPGALPPAVDIPLANYGTSNVGQMKTVYRRGLGHRYGRPMQTIAGVHFNFSLTSTFTRQLAALRGDGRPADIAQSAAYFVLLRNVRRYAWLILYLFGASPAVCRSFLEGRERGLQLFDDTTLYLPNATSLRMSDIGYSNSAQSRLNISCNSLEEYVGGLTRAIQTAYPAYADIGTIKNGVWQQLSTSILQIANEFYSVVRPKRVARSGEKPTSALRERGVEYVEIRALDVNPFEPVGISADQIRFLECFLLMCAVGNCDVIGPVEQVEIDANQLTVAREGRSPRLPMTRHGEATTLYLWSQDLFDRLEPIAASCDDAAGGSVYVNTIAAYRKSVADPSLTPSARVLELMRERRLGHARFGVDLAQQHADVFAGLPPFEPARAAEMEGLAAQSLAQQAEVEADDDIDFKTYLERYYAQP
ncbi:MAG: glutamate--cysteine ligase [Pseudomonadota bacterium]